jgi:RimJ/RimL family protein N-acetyltransferase
MMRDVILETERLALRRLRAEDVETLVALWTDPEVTRHLGGPRDAAKVRERLVAEAGSPTPRWPDLAPLVEKASGRVIGDCGLLEKDVEGRAELEVVYVLARDAWGRGFATEIARALVVHALDVMGRERVIALIEPEHAASARVAEKAGLRFEREIVRPSGARREIWAT